MKRSHRRPPVTFEQVNLMAAMLDLMTNEDDTITEEQAHAMAPSKRLVGLLVTKGMLEKIIKKGPYGRGIKKVSYRFTEDGRTVAKGMKILAEKQKD